MTQRKWFPAKWSNRIEDIYFFIARNRGKLYAVEIIDTAGQEEFKFLREQWMKAVDGAILLYSTTSRSSFDEILIWISHFKLLQSPLAKFGNIIYLFWQLVIGASKIDLIGERQVSSTELKELGDQEEVPFVECSAKDDTNLKEIFGLALRACLECLETRKRTSELTGFSRDEWM